MNTPGPWQIEEGTLLVWSLEDGRPIKPILKAEGNHSGGFQRGLYADGESKANAILAARAPCLLASCKALMALIENGTLQRNIDGDDKPNWSMKMMELVQTLKDAQLAIERAEAK